MGLINIPSLPVAIALDGTEEVWIVQGGATDKRTTTYAIASLSAGITTGARLQRSITSAANLPLLGTDSILNVNVVSSISIAIPVYSTRHGAPLTFKNLPSSHIITLTATGTDTFDGLTGLPLAAGSAVSLVPYNDGVNTGYAIE